MHGFNGNIDQLTTANTDFRRVTYTGHHLQLVLMSLPPGGEIGLETHPDTDQFFRFEAGEGTVVIDDNEYAVTDGSAIVVPAGARHNVVNTSSTDPLQLYTVYAPSHHKDGLVRHTREEADAQPEDFDGVTTE